MTKVDSDMIKNSIQGPGLFKEALNSITMDANSYISLHIILDKFAIFYSETIPPPQKKSFNDPLWGGGTFNQAIKYKVPPRQVSAW